jgi:hypothetical protein
MIVEKVDEGRECYGDYSMSDNTITIGGIPIDLVA